MSTKFHERIDDLVIWVSFSSKNMIAAPKRKFQAIRLILLTKKFCDQDASAEPRT